MILWVWGRWIWTRTLFTLRTTAPSLLPLLFNSSQCLRLDDFMIKSISRLEIEVTWSSKNSNKIFVLFSDTLVDMIPARNIPFKLVEMGFNLKWWCWCQENKRWRVFWQPQTLYIFTTNAKISQYREVGSITNHLNMELRMTLVLC